MRKIALALALTIGIGGCASIGPSVDVSPRTAYVAVNSFNIAEATATNYLRLKKCVGTAMPLCRDPGATAKIIPAVRAGRTARDEVRQGRSGSINILSASTSTLNAIYQQYSIRRGQ